MNAGTFRPDLYYRLRVVPLEVPPLRERGDDVRLLTHVFVQRFREETGRPELTISEAALRLLGSHGWPGNVRELKNAVERAVLLCEGHVLDAPDFDVVRPQPTIPGHFSLPAEGVDLEQLEIHLLRQALERSGGNRTRAAALLGMNRDQIRYRILKFDLEADAGRLPSELAE
jgi:DNA-binding NtrC family response regulator